MVLFDVSCLDTRRISGVGIYAKCLSAALMAKNDYPIKPVFKFSRYLRRQEITDHCGVRTKPYLSCTLAFRKYSLFHGPDYKIPREHRHRKVVTVHDLAIFEPGLVEPSDAEGMQAKFREHIIRRKPDAILFPSQFTKKHFQKYFPESQAQLFVTPLGCDHIRTTPSTSKNLIGSPYILYVGAIEVRKNVSRIISTFEALKSRPEHSALKLVIVGHKGFGGGRLVRQMSNSKYGSDILHLGFLQQKDLPALYKHALFFMYPSLYEGFGIPVLEAMMNGCPVMTSKESAMSEVSGPAAVLVDPLNVDEMVESAHELLMSQDVRSHLAARGFERSKHLTWRRCADLTESAYAAVLRTGPLSCVPDAEISHLNSNRS